MRRPLPRWARGRRRRQLILRIVGRIGEDNPQQRRTLFLHINDYLGLGKFGLQALVFALESGEITLDEDIRARAQGCIQRMLDFTAAQSAGAAPPASGFVPKIGAA